MDNEDYLDSIAKLSWQKTAMMIECFHLNCVLVNKGLWSVRKTSDALGRSLGSVSEFLRLSLAIRIYPEVSEFKTKESALDYLKARGKCKIYPCTQWSAGDIEGIITSLREAVNNGTT